MLRIKSGNMVTVNPELRGAMNADLLRRLTVEIKSGVGGDSRNGLIIKFAAEDFLVSKARIFGGKNIA